MENDFQKNLKILAQEQPLFAIKEIVQRHDVRKGAAIPILQDIQNTFGYVSGEMLQRAAEFSGIPVSELYSIVTFYAQFRLEPIGENLIQVCHGTACHLAGAEKITESLQFETKAPAGKTSPDGLFTLEKVACLGCCSLAPVITINEETHGRLTPDKIRKIIKETRKQSAEKAESKGEYADA
jgi:NADH-quinone oxidoreductase subunit E